MAGAGYKLFNTGDVLTAAQVNTYLMEQTVMVFANAAARTTALSGVVSEGMISYLKDTNAVEVYDGSNWVSSDDPNAIQNTIVDAKGDLISATAADTPARLAVGNNGETLVADSSASVGLRYQEPKTQNPIINSSFQVWQRGTSFTNCSSVYVADRWFSYTNGVTTGRTITRQTTSDTTNLPFIQYCARVARDSGNTNTSGITLSQPMETVDSIAFAGKTVTLSFYARRGANYSAASDALIVYLVTGTGTDQNQQGSGYTGQALPINSSATLTTTWQRFTFTGTIAQTATEICPVFVHIPVGTAGANDWFEVTGVQLEAGSVATPYRTYSATLAGELAACQRYYFRQGGQTLYQRMANGAFNSTTNAFIQMPHPVTMRTAPTSVDYSTMALNDYTSTVAITSISIDYAGGSMTSLSCAVASGGTQYRPVQLLTNNSTSAYVGLSAELQK